MSTRPVRPLGVMILALLRERDMHPYEMMRLLRHRRENRLVSIQNGTFYNQIAGLVRDGWIAEAGTDREGNRPERTTYTLLPAGAAEIVSWVRERLGSTDRPDEFAVALAEAHNLPREEVVVLLRQRVDQLATLRDEYQGGYTGALAKPVDRQYLVELQRAIALLNADIEFTESLCADLAAGALQWGEPSESHRASQHFIAGKDDA
ncbi:PadR family transcriptional regulator [Microbacterium sp. GXS0129]|uniref:PadR family transcriptional regulator n=1 Tax=Microbacterium sp. GXS0129 TaxID=3377836 RepID=UPI00383A5340